MSVAMEFCVWELSSGSRVSKCEGGVLGGRYHSARVMEPVSVCMVNHERSAVGESSVWVMVMWEWCVCRLGYRRRYVW